MSNPVMSPNAHQGHAAPTEGALAGILVLDVSTGVAASHCCELLFGLGAQVIKIEQPGEGDASRLRGPFLQDDSEEPQSGLFHYVNGGKLGITLNLRAQEGQRLLHELVRRAAVVVEDRKLTEHAGLGLDRATLQAANPGAIIASITPFGRTGPYSNYHATDLILAHAGGIAYATPGLVADPPSQPPLRPGSYQASFVAALAAANNIVAAVLASELHPGQPSGCYIDFSCTEAAVNVFRQSMGSYGFHATGLGRNLAKGRGAGGQADVRSICCKDGFIQILWGRWEPLKQALGNPEWMQDPRVATAAARNYEVAFIEENLSAWASQFKKQELFHMLQGRGVPCAPVNSGRDLLESDELDQRQFFDDVSGLSDREVRFPGAPAKLSETPWLPHSRGPRSGEHNAQVFGGMLGLDDNQLARLRSAAVI